MAERLLGRKELAATLARSERYVDYMKAAGFSMIGGRTTVTSARRFLKRVPHPSAVARARSRR
jgi:hypothetical protein